MRDKIWLGRVWMLIVVGMLGVRNLTYGRTPTGRRARKRLLAMFLAADESSFAGNFYVDTVPERQIESRGVGTNDKSSLYRSSAFARVTNFVWNNCVI
jgi:hypothetical protein